MATDPGQILQEQIQKNFPKFGSIRRSCIYRQMGSADYDADTGTVNPEEIAQFPLLAIFDNATSSAMSNLNIDLDGTTIRNLKVAIFPTLDLPIEPKEKDIIVREDSSQWVVVGVIPDPAKAHWELVVRPWLEIA
jgi:hypothetical protein